MELRKASPVVMIAKDDPGELAGQRHATTLGGLRALSAANQSHNAPLRFGAARKSEMAPNTRSRRMVQRLPCLVIEPSFSFLPLIEFAGRHAKPSGEIAAGFEGLRTGCWPEQGSGERADAGDARRQPADRIASMVGDDRALELVDRRAWRDRNCWGRNLERRLDHLRKVGGGGSFDEFLDEADPFGGDDTELRQMTQGVHAHRAA